VTHPAPVEQASYLQAAWRAVQAVLVLLWHHWPVFLRRALAVEPDVLLLVEAEAARLSLLQGKLAAPSRSLNRRAF